jgi:hypothetical protein
VTAIEPAASADVLALEEEYDQVAVEPAETPGEDTSYYDVYGPVAGGSAYGNYETTIPHEDVVALTERGHVAVIDRATGERWKP